MHNKTGRDVKQNPENSDNDIDEYELYYDENALHGTEDAREKPPGPLSRRPSFTSAIPALSLSVIFIICTYMPESHPFYDQLWASRESVFSKHEYWRLITAILMHADSLHLLSNMPLFILFGFFLYEYFGFMLFPLISFAAGVCSNIITLYFYPDSVRLAGSSGMIYAMAALWLVMFICHDTGHTMSVRIFRSAGFALIVLFPETYNPSTSYMAHAAGFAAGIIFALVALRFVKIKRAKGSHAGPS